MDFLTIDMVKQSCRIEDYSKDPAKQKEIDQRIKSVATLAEELVYEHIGKDFPSIMEQYGKIPVPIIQAALLATADMYMMKPNPEENSVFKLLLKPYKPEKRVL